MNRSLRRADDRGAAQNSWLQSCHTFSFGRYRDARHQQFRALRVMNEDVFQPGGGFGMHPHDNMEIVTVVLSGTLEHRDSMGHGGKIQAGDVQRMTAGRGLRHSETNPSADEPVHLYQIWLLPNEQNLTPEYEQTSVLTDPHAGPLQLIASADAEHSSMHIHADAQILFGALQSSIPVNHRFNFGRHAWLQVLSGAVFVPATDSESAWSLQAGDGLAVSDEDELTFTTLEASQVLLFELK